MWLANIVCVAMIQFWANANTMTLGKIWWALAVSAFVSIVLCPVSVKCNSNTESDVST